MDIKLPLLRTFITLAEAGNLQDAADQLGRSPSAVSMALKQLEDAIGGALFERDRKNALTPLGHHLFETAQDQLAAFGRSMAAAQALAKGELGRVELACVPSVAINLLPSVIMEFTKKWEHVELDVHDIDTLSVIRAVERGTVELGIAGRPKAGAVTFRLLFKDSLVLVEPDPGRRMEKNPSISWNTLKTRTLITNGIMSNSDRPEILALHAAATLMVRNTTSLLALVKSGVGSTILPAFAVPTGYPGVQCRPIGDISGVTREVGIIRKQDTVLSPAAEAFVQVLDEYVSKLSK